MSWQGLINPTETPIKNRARREIIYRKHAVMD